MKSFKEKIKTLKYAFTITKGNNVKLFFLSLAQSLLTTVIPLIPTYFIGKIVDELAGGKNIEKLTFYAVAMVVLSVFAYFLDSITDISQGKVNDKMYFFEREIFMKKIVTLDYELLENKDFQDNVRAYKNASFNNGAVSMRVWWFLTSITSGFLGIVFSLIMVKEPIMQCLKIDNSNFLTSVWFLVIFAVYIGFLAAVMAVIGNEMQKKEAVSQVEMNKSVGLYNYWLDFPKKYKNGKEIRIFGAKKLINNLSDRHINESTVCHLDNIKNARKKTLTINYTLQSLLMGGFFMFVALKAYAGLFSVGELSMFIGVATTVAGSIGMLSNIPYLLGVECTTIGYLKNVLEAKPVKSAGTKKIECKPDSRYEIEFRNVSFTYPGTDKMILKNVSIKLTVGERLAIVGMNGSGKTTFIKLLCRLYDPTEGEILLDGINIKEYDLMSYMQIFSVVFQDFKLFSLPLDENVAASVSCDKERLWDSLKKAGINERVMKMTKQEKTTLYKDFDENGVEISGGEAQKLALARALYRDASFIILDEPTAALDPISEYEIYERFNSLVGDKTAIYISHRLSSCRFCDKIAVFNDGQIVETGTHDELVADEGTKYNELWNAQARYYTH